MDPTEGRRPLTGVFAPITTAFGDDEALDLDGLEANIGIYARSGIDGYLALGSNGENRSLTEEERLQVLEVVVRSKEPGQRVMAGAMYAALRDTRRFLTAAAEIGAEFGLVMPPDYFRKQMTDDILYEYYASVAESSPIPVLIYHAPQFCSVGVSVALVERLAALPGIAGLKWSAPEGIGDVLPLGGDGFDVLAGSASFLLETVTGGGTGGTVSIADYLPELAVELYRTAKSGDRSQANALQERVRAINRSVSGVYGVSGVKAAMDFLGLEGGNPRRPLRPLTSGERAELHQALADQGVTP